MAGLRKVRRTTSWASSPHSLVNLQPSLVDVHVKKQGDIQVSLKIVTEGKQRAASGMARLVAVGASDEGCGRGSSRYGGNKRNESEERLKSHYDYSQ